MRPLFAYLNAAVVSTAVYAAAADWGTADAASDRGLAERIDWAAGELARAMAGREAPPVVDPFGQPTPFTELLDAARRPD